ncbi:flavin reductase family protein [Nocardia sp. NPDC059246]|uniref:flavin reductase family protein n=1 Tax=unclassified Nocardia TaxID=2637762 RepID=UPI00369E96BB
MTSVNLRDAFGRVPSGVAAIAAHVNGQDQVLVVSTFTSGVSLDPPLVTIAVQKSSTTWPKLRPAHRLGVSILSDDQDALCRQLSDRNSEARWVGVAIERDECGSIHIPASALHLTCSLDAEHSVGDHTVAVLRVQDFAIADDRYALIFHRSRFGRIAR